jgi:hypothetical protein
MVGAGGLSQEWWDQWIWVRRRQRSFGNTIKFDMWGSMSECQVLQRYNWTPGVSGVMIWFIWQTHFQLQGSTSEYIPSHLKFDRTTEGFDIWWHSCMLWCNHPAELPSPASCSYSLIPSFLTKSSGPHYLPSLSPSIVVSATPWRSEWMKYLHTAIHQVLMH